MLEFFYTYTYPLHILQSFQCRQWNAIMAGFWHIEHCGVCIQLVQFFFICQSELLISPEDLRNVFIVQNLTMKAR